MEFITKSVRAYDKTCVGCERQNADIMLTLKSKEGLANDIYNDVFLTNEQAQEVINELTLVIAKNLQNE